MKVVLVLRVIVLTVVYCGLCLLPYGCRTWVVPLCCNGPHCKAGELLGQALSQELPLAVVKSPSNWGGRKQNINDEGLLSSPLSGLTFCRGHPRQVHFAIES